MKLLGGKMVPGIELRFFKGRLQYRFKKDDGNWADWVYVPSANK